MDQLKFVDPCQFFPSSSMDTTCVVLYVVQIDCTNRVKLLFALGERARMGSQERHEEHLAIRF
jgi:hypothetical protein